MDISLAIKVLEALILIVGAFCAFVLVFMIKDVSKICEDLYRKVDAFDSCSNAIVRELEKLNHNPEKDARNELRDVIMRKILNDMLERNRIHVEDDKPLDFPNSEK